MNNMRVESLTYFIVNSMHPNFIGERDDIPLPHSRMFVKRLINSITL